MTKEILHRQQGHIFFRSKYYTQSDAVCMRERGHVSELLAFHSFWGEMGGRVVRRREEFSITEDPEVTVALIAKVIEKV